MSGDPVARAARAAARKLAGQLGPQLEIDVEAALNAPGWEQPPTRYFDPVALGSLIVSISALAWQIYRDLKKDRRKPTARVLARATRVERRKKNGNVSAVEQEIIEIVAEELIKG
jgi:hypothetical protein